MCAPPLEEDLSAQHGPAAATPDPTGHHYASLIFHWSMFPEPQELQEPAVPSRTQYSEVKIHN